MNKFWKQRTDQCLPGVRGMTEEGHEGNERQQEGSGVEADQCLACDGRYMNLYKR